MAQLKTPEDFLSHLKASGIQLPFCQLSGGDLALAEPIQLPWGKVVGNRFAILPMEGWDGTNDGMPTEFTVRRWNNFACSGAKLLWGCEAVAVRHDGRANPRQLVINDKSVDSYQKIIHNMLELHQRKFGNSDDLLVGLQLTHSGRYANPSGKPNPMILYGHSILNNQLRLPPDYPLITDDYIDRLVDDFVQAGKFAAKAGFGFIDIKHCHGYLGHEFLSSYHRDGKYGGSLQNRLRFLRSIVQGLRAATSIPIGVRLSVFDWIPFRTDKSGAGIPWQDNGKYREAFGGDTSGTGIDVEEVSQLLSELQKLGIDLICTTAGSPYYNPHIQRPALFPPSDGYLPPEDPLAGVARQINITAKLKSRFPEMIMVGSAYSYLQEWLPHVAEAVVRQKGADFIGLGRMVLSYPELPLDVLRGEKLQRGKLCRTFSDCTTAPRNDLISGCYPLDPFYKKMPQAQKLKSIKKHLNL